MRVKMPDTEVFDPPRWKRGPIVEVKSQPKVDELVAQGGVVLPDELEAESETASPPAAAATSKSPKGSAKKRS